MSNANEIFEAGNGDYYRHFTGIVYTDGVKHLCESCEANWLIDLICSYQGVNYVKAQQFQVWKLFRVKDTEFIIVATDGNDNRIVSQKIPFSDFPYDEATIWVSNKTLLLPCEY